LLGARALKRHQKRLGTYQQTAIRAASTGSSSSLRCALHTMQKVANRGTTRAVWHFGPCAPWLFLAGPGHNRQRGCSGCVAAPAFCIPRYFIERAVVNGNATCFGEGEGEIVRQSCCKNRTVHFLQDFS
jgi:hypothetical protein